MQPQITVILSFLNPGAHFDLALKSIFAQTYGGWELVLLDDGSKDGSLERARSLADPRVRVYSDGATRHLNVRLNQMVDLVRTPFIARMDADDVMHPERLERQYGVLRASDASTVLGTGAYSIDAQSRVAGRKPVHPSPPLSAAASRIFIHPTVAASAEWFRRHRYSESPLHRRAQDAELWSRAAAASRFRNLPEPLLFYREAGSFSLERYIGSSVGMLCTGAARMQQSRWRGLRMITRDAAKLWAVSMATALGMERQIVRHRSRRVSAQETAAAEAVLDGIGKLRLPLRESSDGGATDWPALQRGASL